MSVLTLIVSLVVIGLVTTGCGGGGSTVANVNLTGTALSTTGTPQGNYKVVLDNGLGTAYTNGTTGAFTISVPPSSLFSVTSPTVTLYFYDTTGASVGSQTITITPAMVSGDTISLGDINNVGVPSPYVRAG
jgi:hypothetical protein